MDHQQFPTKEEIVQAVGRIQKFINPTPVLTNQYINHLASAHVLFKCENFQKTGSFKVRGATNKITQLNNVNMICAHSSGNHAQAVAYVGKKLGIKTKIVMPIDTPQVKKNAVKGYGAEVVESGPTMADQEKLSSKISKQQNATLIHPYNDFKVITGAASIGYQIYSQYKDIDYVVFPIGGGGLASGTLLATRYFSPNTKCIGVQPYLARDAYLSIATGKIHPQFPPKTLGQGVRTGIGQKTFAIMRKYIDDVILVSEQEMIDAGKIFMERMKMIVELSGVIVLAAILKDARFKDKKVMAIISGGNMDLSFFFQSLSKPKL